MIDIIKNTSSSQLIDKIERTSILGLDSDGILSGKLGLAYYYYFLHTYSNEESHLLKVKEILEIVFNNIDSGKSDLLLSSTLGYGLSGLGYLLDILLEDEVIDKAFKTQTDEINFVVTEEAIRFIKDSNYDFVSGSIGILFYLNSVGYDDGVNKIIELLHDNLVKDEYFFFENNTDYLEGTHIGYAHGLCAIIQVLNSVDNRKAEIILQDQLNKLTDLIESNNHFIQGHQYYLPRSIHGLYKNKESLNFRAVLAWSNSDLNFATLIFSLQKKFLNEKIIRLAHTIAKNSTLRILEKHTRVWDSRFYFGASGVIHMYNYLYKETGDKLYRNSARIWYKIAQDYLQNENLESHTLDFINNLPATALVFLQTENPDFNSWSKLMLI